MLENLDSEFTTTSSELKISAEAKAFLLVAAKWANFLSIMGFIAIGLMGISSLVLLTKFGHIGLESLISIGSVIVYIFPTLYMHRFAKNMREGLDKTRQFSVDEGFENLKSMFKFLGIFTIVIVSVYVLLFIVAMLGLSMGGF